MLTSTLCHTTIPVLGYASGVITTHEQLDYFIVSKSATINPQEGNTLPRLYINDHICINNMGLPNKGLNYYLSYPYQNFYILSVYAYTIDELDILFNHHHSWIEVNLSCPNVNNIIHIENYLIKIHQIKKDKKVGVKLPPLFNKQDIVDLSQLLLKYQIDFITCSNTIPNCLVVENNKTVLNNHYGGMSFKPLALSNVFQFYQLLKDKIDIMGCGGIQTGQDAYEYILCGATCVQVGSQCLREENSLQRIEKELQDIMLHQNDKSINDFKGKVNRSKL